MKKETSVAQMLNSKPTCPQQFNRILRQEGVEEKLVRGRGYYYFADGESSAWYSSSIGVYRITSCEIGFLLAEYLILKYDYRNDKTYEVRYAKDATKFDLEVTVRSSVKNASSKVFGGNPLEVLRWIQKQEKLAKEVDAEQEAITNMLTASIKLETFRIAIYHLQVEIRNDKLTLDETVGEIRDLVTDLNEIADCLQGKDKSNARTKAKQTSVA
jgi:hypothetical protein